MSNRSSHSGWMMIDLGSGIGCVGGWIGRDRLERTGPNAE